MIGLEEEQDKKMQKQKNLERAEFFIYMYRIDKGKLNRK